MEEIKGTFCIYKEGNLEFSNKNPNPLLHNYLNGLYTLGAKLFDEKMKFVCIDTLIISVDKMDDFLMVCIESSKEKCKELYQKHKSIIQEKL